MDNQVAAFIISMFTQKQNPIKSLKRQQNTRSSSGISDELTLEEQKKRKFFIKQSIYFLYFIFRIGLVIYLLVILFQNFIQQLFLTQEYSRMQENIQLWKEDVIINMTTVNSYTCPQGYQTYTSYQWPGTKQGCFCYTVIDQWDYIKILQGQCSDMAISAGCINVPPKKPIPILFWEKDILICVKRVNGLNFFVDLDRSLVSSVHCAKGLDHQFRIPDKLNVTLCPLSDISKDKKLSQQLPMIDFTFSRESSYPVVALKMTEYQFCPQYNRDNISPFKQRQFNYNLELVTKKYCWGKDARVILIDQKGEDELFANNPRISEVIKELPAYPQPMSEYIYKLGFVRYPQWSYSCRVSEKFRLSRVQSQLNLDEISSYVISCSAVGATFIVIIGLLLTLFFIYRKTVEFYYKNQQNVLYDTLPQLQRKKPNLYEKIHKKFKTELIIFVFQLIVGIVVLIILAVVFVEIQQYFQWYQQSRKCTSKMMKQWIETGYIKYFDLEQRNILLCIILVLCLLLIDTIMFLWRNFKGDLKKEDYDQQVTNIFDEDLKNQTNQENIHSISQFPLANKDIQLDQKQASKPINYQPEKNNSDNQINYTEENFFDVDYVPRGKIVKQRRHKRGKHSQLSNKSRPTEEQWDI